MDRPLVSDGILPGNSHPVTGNYLASQLRVQRHWVKRSKRADSPSEVTPIGLGVSKATGAGTGQTGLGEHPQLGAGSWSFL